jgi:hypothetical protein
MLYWLFKRYLRRYLREALGGRVIVSGCLELRQE